MRKAETDWSLAERMPTIDANCWISSFDPNDVFHEPSQEFLRDLARRALLMYGPEIVLLEVGCAIARRHRDPSQGVRVMQALRQNPLMRIYPHDQQLMREAFRIGTRQYLRGADALYAATASLTSEVLVTWDKELVERAGAMTPTAWLSENP